MIPISHWAQVESRLILAMVFTLSAVVKVRSAPARAGFRAAFGALGGRLVRRATGTLAGRALPGAVPAVEVALAAGLLVPASADPALAGAVVVLAAFGAALAAALRRGAAVSCNCFGVSHRPVSRAQLARNTLLVAVAVLGLLGSRGDSGAGPVGLPALLVGLLGAGAAAWIVSLWEDLTDLLAAPR
ncbi:MauE/DoxX family redox-associated membrane protein [Streptomyces polygonati]|uniref:MauE/DoxX family redox-associated membrane protein n=1 Tax=Streptomyces polygonati TaxID=1617087 RepID=A0ABV8HVZ9_9ACTN